MKVGVVDIGVCILSYLKEELAWAVDKWLWVLSTITLFKEFCVGRSKGKSVLYFP